MVALWLAQQPHRVPGFDSSPWNCWDWGTCSPQVCQAQVGYPPVLSVWILHALPMLTWIYSVTNSNTKNMQEQIALPGP